LSVSLDCSSPLSSVGSKVQGLGFRVSGVYREEGVVQVGGGGKMIITLDGEMINSSEPLTPHRQFQSVVDTDST
jgi:hypothetical protein